MLSVSATTPWPAKAASPCTSTGRTWSWASNLCRPIGERPRAGPAVPVPSPRRRAPPPRGARGWTPRKRRARARPGAERTPEPLVVLDVARTLDTRGVEIAFELAEELLVALAHDVYEHVEAAPVGHPHHRVPMAMIGRGRRAMRPGAVSPLPPLPAQNAFARCTWSPGNVRALQRR